MKVFFTTSFWGKPRYQRYVDRIVAAIESTGATVVSPEKSREYKTSFTKENIKAYGDRARIHYEFIRQGIANADAVVIEASHEDFRIGHEATLAIIYKKPVLCLSLNTDYGKLVRHEAFRGVKYDERNLESTVLAFLEQTGKSLISKRSVPLSHYKRWPAAAKQQSGKSVGVLGAINVDLITKVPFVPHENETVISEGLKVSPGGKATNTAIALSRLGQKTYMIGRVGNDAFSENVRNAFKLEGVNTDFVDTDNFSPTGTVMVNVDSRGKHTVVVNEDANARISRKTITDFFRSKGSGRQKVDAFYATREALPEIVEAGIRNAAKHGIPVMVLSAPQARPLDEKLYGLVDFLVANRQNVKAMTGVGVEDPQSGAEAALALVEKGARNAIVTLGFPGAVILRQGKRECEYYPGFRVPVVDETAAGDAFCAGFLATWLQTGDMRKAMRYANLCGAFAVTRFGSYDAMPSLDQLELFRPEINPNLRRQAALE